MPNYYLPPYEFNLLRCRFVLGNKAFMEHVQVQ
jgi:hypothetical protein